MTFNRRKDLEKKGWRSRLAPKHTQTNESTSLAHGFPADYMKSSAEVVEVFMQTLDSESRNALQLYGTAETQLYEM